MTLTDERDPGERYLGMADRVDVLLVLALLVFDAVLLAVLEVMFVTLQFGTVPLPISALVALVSTPWLVRRAGDLPTGVPGAAAVFLAWTLTVGVLGLTHPGGDLLLPPDWPALALLAAGLLPGGVALGRVIRRAREGDPRRLDPPGGSVQASGGTR